MADHPPTSIVSARDVVLRHGPVVAVNRLNEQIPAGITAIIGPNGSGKSSLLQAISGLLTVAEGDLDVLGQAARPGNPEVAHVLQSTGVNAAMPLTVLDVVRMGRHPHLGLLGRFTSADHDAVAEAMERLGVTDLAGRQIRELSGGQQQRAFVAQGIAQRSDLLLLDEPITGLDLPSQDRIAAAIREEAAQGRSVVLTTHDIATAATADHVILLATHVVASGPPDDVLAPDHLAHAYGASTFRAADGTLVIADPHVHGTALTGHEDH